jgi:hypothetical protein
MVFYYIFIIHHRFIQVNGKKVSKNRQKFNSPPLFSARRPPLGFAASPPRKASDASKRGYHRQRNGNHIKNDNLSCHF